MTFEELRDKQQSLFQKMKEAQTLIELPPGRRAERLARCEVDKLEYFRLYFPHYFAKNDYALYHPEMLSCCDIKDVPVFMAGPRGGAKTTFCTFGDVMHKITYKIIRFGIIGGMTEDIATNFNSDLLLEFETNPRIKQDFGNLQGSYSWAADDFITRSNIRMKARSIMQRIRGLKHGDVRPDLFTADDVEDDVSARSPDRVKALINWFWSAVYPAMRPRSEGGCYMRWVGTMISRLSALFKIFADKKRKVIKKKWSLVQRDDAGRRISMWPSRFPLSECDKIRDQVGPIVWQAEYQNDPLPEEDRVFSEDWDKFYTEAMSPNFIQALTVGAADPSATELGDDKAITVGSSFYESPIVYCRHAIIQKMGVDPFVEALDDLSQKYQCRIRVEDNALKDFLWKTVSSYEDAHNKHLPLDPVHHSKNKILRINGLQGPWQRGEYRFIEGHSDQDKLRDEGHLFPDGSDNGLDAWEETCTGIDELKLSGNDDVAGTGQRRDFVVPRLRENLEFYLLR